ncbi:hypothetical protein [Microcoleus sp. FACHB-1515]|nr:hypothetical protein [Microcoleus sp. FACHB-1515]
MGRTLTLKVKYADYHLITRSKTTVRSIDSIDLTSNIRFLAQTYQHYV